MQETKSGQEMLFLVPLIVHTSMTYYCGNCHGHWSRNMLFGGIVMADITLICELNCLDILLGVICGGQPCCLCVWTGRLVSTAGIREPCWPTSVQFSAMFVVKLWLIKVLFRQEGNEICGTCIQEMMETNREWKRQRGHG